MTSANVEPRHRYVFICGLHRSGTSPLHEIMKLHPLMSGFSGTGKPKDEGQHLQSVLGRDGDYGGPGAFCFDPRAHLTEKDVPEYAERLPELFSSWAPLWAPYAPVRIEKSPPNLIRSRFLQAVFNDARFVFIVRHPLAVARATRKWSHAPEEALFRHWLKAHQLMLEDVPFLQRSCCIRYEDLVADRHRTLARVWRLAEVSGIAPDMESFVDHNANYLDTSGAFPLDADEQRLMETFGYEMAAPFTRFDRAFGW